MTEDMEGMTARQLAAGLSNLLKDYQATEESQAESAKYLRGLKYDLSVVRMQNDLLREQVEQLEKDLAASNTQRDLHAQARLILTSQVRSGEEKVAALEGLLQEQANLKEYSELVGRQALQIAEELFDSSAGSGLLGGVNRMETLRDLARTHVPGAKRIVGE